MAVEKNRWLQVRMEGHERDVIDELAKEYHVNTSAFVRMAIDHIKRARPTLSIYPLTTEEDEERFAELPIRAWLQMRMSSQERESLESVAADYGLDSSKFVRVILGYFRETRPKLALVPKGNRLVPGNSSGIVS